MIYKEISWKDYLKLQDQTGAYLILWSSGIKQWVVNDLCHREDGPAVEGANGAKFWYIHGKKYETEEEWEVALYELKAKEIKDLIV